MENGRLDRTVCICDLRNSPRCTKTQSLLMKKKQETLFVTMLFPCLTWKNTGLEVLFGTMLTFNWIKIITIEIKLMHTEKRVFFYWIRKLDRKTSFRSIFELFFNLRMNQAQRDEYVIRLYSARKESQSRKTGLFWVILFRHDWKDFNQLDYNIIIFWL